jgi:hypothetical protein
MYQEQKKGDRSWYFIGKVELMKKIKADGQSPEDRIIEMESGKIIATSSGLYKIKK